MIQILDSPRKVVQRQVSIERPVKRLPAGEEGRKERSRQSRAQLLLPRGTVCASERERETYSVAASERGFIREKKKGKRVL